MRGTKPILFFMIFIASVTIGNSAYANDGGLWRIDFHRFNKTGNDPGKVNLRTLLATVTARAVKGKFSLESYKSFSTEKNFSRTFNGRISKKGALRARMRVDGLFGPLTDFQFVSAKGNVLNAKVGRKYSFFGTKLWRVTHKRENVFLRLDVTKIST